MYRIASYSQMLNFILILVAFFFFIVVGGSASFKADVEGEKAYWWLFALSLLVALTAWLYEGYLIYKHLW